MRGAGPADTMRSTVAPLGGEVPLGLQSMTTPAATVSSYGFSTVADDVADLLDLGLGLGLGEVGEVGDRRGRRALGHDQGDRLALLEGDAACPRRRCPPWGSGR